MGFKKWRIEIPHTALVFKRLGDLHKFKADRHGALKFYDQAKQEYIKAECCYLSSMHFNRRKRK